jgi:hypothetical protein
MWFLIDQYFEPNVETEEILEMVLALKGNQLPKVRLLMEMDYLVRPDCLLVKGP